MGTQNTMEEMQQRIDNLENVISQFTKYLDWQIKGHKNRIKKHVQTISESDKNDVFGMVSNYSSFLHSDTIRLSVYEECKEMLDENLSKSI